MFVIIIIITEKDRVYTLNFHVPIKEHVRTYVPEINNKKIKQGIHIRKGIATYHIIYFFGGPYHIILLAIHLICKT